MTKTKQTVIKATVTDAPGAESAIGALNHSLQNVESIQGLLDPPYDLKKLSLIYEMSGILQQHIESITTNVDLFGWRYEPAVKFDDTDILKNISEAIYCERIHAAEKSGTAPESVELPTTEEVTARLTQLESLSKVELNRLKIFFSTCYPDGSFIDLRSKTRKNLEITGNCFWEILRDGTGRVSKIVLAPVSYMRLMPLDKSPTEVTERVPISDLAWEPTKQAKYFRRFAEVGNDQKKVKAYFKEYGDPRVVSRLTGKYFDTVQELEKDKNFKDGDGAATEILHLKIYSAQSDPYGVPRWIGNLPAVLGSRELDEVNLGYFENKTVPPLALLVAGGRLAKGVVPRIEEFIEQNLKGRKNFHKILILEAEGQKNAQGMNVIPTVKFVPLREAQQQDGLFQRYDEANWQKIGSSFRLPRILVGRDETINRATAEASLTFAEAQVFEPMRNFFDELINRKVVADLSVTFWKFRSNTPTTRDPTALSDIIKKLSDCGTLTPAEGRIIATDVFNRELPRIDAQWTKQPFRLTIAEARKGVLEGELGAPGDELAGDTEVQTAQDLTNAQEQTGDTDRNTVVTTKRAGFAALRSLSSTRSMDTDDVE
jgi:PBSX family phage portal protein